MIDMGREQIGADQKPYIIADVGNNWQKLEDCLIAIDSAKTAGADAIKFHLVNFRAMYGLEHQYQPKWWRQDSELQIDWLAKLRNRADTVGIELLVATYDPQTLRSIDHLVKAHCVTAGDINYLELLNTAASCRKPVFLYGGASTEGAILYALSALKQIPTVLMYSVEDYPAKSVNLFTLDLYAKVSKYFGYCDNTVDASYIPTAAVRNHKAMVLEKHFNATNADTPDKEFSLDPLAFGAMVDFVTAKRTPNIMPVLEERNMLLKNRRRLVATKDVKEGGKLVYNGNYGVYRTVNPSLDALQPHMLHEMDRAAASKPIAAGEALTMENVRL